MNPCGDMLTNMPKNKPKNDLRPGTRVNILTTVNIHGYITREQAKAIARITSGVFHKEMCLVPGTRGTVQRGLIVERPYTSDELVLVNWDGGLGQLWVVRNAVAAISTLDLMAEALEK